MNLRNLLIPGIPKLLATQLVETYTETKRNVRVGGHRLTAVEGGRFCEAAYRALEHATQGAFTPLNASLDTHKLSRDLAQLPKDTVSDSVRLHIPRCLRVIYDIRSKRDAAHLADGIDPNVQDSSLIVACSSWVLAEFVRLNHGIDADEAARVVERIVSRDTPAIQYFDGEPRVLGKLPASDVCLLLLYAHRGEAVNINVLKSSVRPSMRNNLARTLQRLDDRDYVHRSGDLVWITYVGEVYVESQGLAGEI